ncbi:MAG: hypothetical protein JOZ82_02150 [Marmoricola sp.]|nr:hypothetical protein [Marmoricola sp.]
MPFGHCGQLTSLPTSGPVTLARGETGEIVGGFGVLVPPGTGGVLEVPTADGLAWEGVALAELVGDSWASGLSGVLHALRPATAIPRTSDERSTPGTTPPG